MWKQGDVSSAVIGIRFGMTQSQFLFSQWFVGYVLVSAYWEWNLRSEAKWCQNASRSFDVTRQLSCSGCDPNTANRWCWREYCWWPYCLSAAHFGRGVGFNDPWRSLSTSKFLWFFKSKVASKNISENIATSLSNWTCCYSATKALP